ncbi:MAG: cupin domain-containing protein [Candidatus Heimdallarchaeota archaeon]|nr:cupin domain-containing protein [Candidatus Heimdallarchaeota archaeon]
MKKIHYTDVEELKVEDYGSTSTTIRWLITKEKDGATNFALRRFEVQPGGEIGMHNHPQEHEIYILSGEIEVITETESFTAKTNDVLYVPPEEVHGYKNNGSKTVSFLCVVPYL